MRWLYELVTVEAKPYGPNGPEPSTFEVLAVHAWQWFRRRWRAKQRRKLRAARPKRTPAWTTQAAAPSYAPIGALGASANSLSALMGMLGQHQAQGEALRQQQLAQQQAMTNVAYNPMSRAYYMGNQQHVTQFMTDKDLAALLGPRRP